MEKQEAIFSFEKETKGALRFQEIDPKTGEQPDNYLVGTLYLRKAALGGGRPTTLHITVSEVVE